MGLIKKRDGMIDSNIDSNKDSSPTLDWKAEKVNDSLNVIYYQSTKIADNAIQWYSRSSSSKKKGARTIRVLSIILGTLAAILPTIGELLPSFGINFEIKAGWTVVLLGVAGVLLLLDRFFGFTSGWMRYIVAELQLKQIKQEFELDWEAERAGWEGNTPTKDQVVQMLARCKAFVSQINTIVRQETDVWVQEFQSTIKYLDESIKAKSASTEPGALNLTVTNGDLATEGWNLTIDNGTSEKFQGRTIGKRNLMPGRHEVNIKANINGKTLQAGKVVSVPAGGTCEETLTLS